MLLRLLRFIAFALMFYFFYRVVISVFRYFTGESRKRTVEGPETPPDLRKTEGTEYLDVRDAQFKDVARKPDDPSTPASSS